MTIKDLLKADSDAKTRITDKDSRDIDMTAVWVILNLSDRKP
jgi:hypothetical protein